MGLLGSTNFPIQKKQRPEKSGRFFIPKNGESDFDTYFYPMQDYLVVGCGLAGISFCEQLTDNKKSFSVIADDSQQASKVAGGLYNPVILKRFTMAWKAHEQMALVSDFYTKLEQKLQVRLDYKIPVLRKFASIEEQNMWFEAADRPNLNKYLSVKISDNQNKEIDAPFGFGLVNDTGRIDTKTLLKNYSNNLFNQGILNRERFEHERLEIKKSHVSYKSVDYKYVVFADGFGLKTNPFFNYLPLNGTKGELLTIKSPQLKENSVVKSSVFIIPLKNDLYRVGATYKWKDKTNTPTEASKQELLKKLNTFLKCDFEVVDHVAGIRPTVGDRRPLVGMHPKNKNMFLLNGFGSRGILIAPYASKQLFNYIENGEKLNTEMDIERFSNRYAQN